MINKNVIFDDGWILEAQNKSSNNSWARAVMDTFEKAGRTYLETLRKWYNGFPHDAKEKKDLKIKLEDLNDVAHLGGVNELSWFELIKHFNWQIMPVSANVRHPDFYISHPSDFYCEVSTLNLSGAETSGIGGLINHDLAANRILRKAIDEKADQLTYAEEKRHPALLAVFDYSSCSGLGTQRYSAIADTLLMFPDLPSALSAFMYVDKGVNEEGKIIIYGERSAVYHNPCASFSLPFDLFDMFPQFYVELKESKLIHNLHSTWILK